MKITKITIRLLKIDASAWYEGNPVPKGESDVMECPLICLSTDEGIDGYVTGYGSNGEGRVNMKMIQDVYRLSVMGEDPIHQEKIWQNLRKLQRHLYLMSDAAMGQLDVALWDIRGKAANLPIAHMLGLYRTSVPAYATGSYFMFTPEKVAEGAKRAKAQGYHGFKLNFYVDQAPAKDIPRLRAAREAVGPDFPLMLDGTSMYSFTDALLVGKELDRLNYLWFEEPIYDRQIGQLKELSRQLTTPILATETSSLAELPEFIRQQAVDLIRGDVMIKGGITGLRKAAAMAELFGVNLEVHTCTSPLLDIANLHVNCAISNSRFVEHHHRLFRFGLKNNALEIDKQGYLHLPKGPGLGVELDWDWIDNNTIEVMTCDAK